MKYDIVCVFCGTIKNSFTAHSSGGILTWKKCQWKSQNLGEIIDFSPKAKQAREKEGGR